MTNTSEWVKRPATTEDIFQFIAALVAGTQNSDGPWLMHDCGVSVMVHTSPTLSLVCTGMTHLPVFMDVFDSQILVNLYVSEKRHKVDKFEPRYRIVFDQKLNCHRSVQLEA